MSNTTCHFCGASIPEESTSCPKCGAPHTPTIPSSSVAADDAPVWWYNLLSFLIPFVGLILYFVGRKQYPKRSKKVLLWTIIGFIVGFIFQIWAYSY